MNDVILFVAGILIGYGVCQLRRANRLVDAILANTLTPPPTLTVYAFDPLTGKQSAGESTYILGGRVPQEPT